MIIVLGGGAVAGLFGKYDDNIVQSFGKLPHELIKNERPKLVVFTGGTDVNPKFYGQNPLQVTDKPDKERDANEALWFSYCRTNKIPMLGICRGSQFGCVMNGGELFQHVTNHAIGGRHSIETDDGDTFDVTSTHHQMMGIDMTDHVLVAWSKEKRSKVFLTDSINSSLKEPDREPEVVWFPNTQFLAVQFHPEFMDHHEAGRGYFFELVESFFPNIED